MFVCRDRQREYYSENRFRTKWLFDTIIIDKKSDASGVRGVNFRLEF